MKTVKRILLDVRGLGELDSFIRSISDNFHTKEPLEFVPTCEGALSL